MEWISVQDRAPKPTDSPILALETLDFFSACCLQYIKGYEGWGWYEANEEYGMGLNPDEAFYSEYSGILYWMPLPDPPKGK